MESTNKQHSFTFSKLAWQHWTKKKEKKKKRRKATVCALHKHICCLQLRGFICPLFKYINFAKFILLLVQFDSNLVHRLQHDSLHS